MKKFRTIGSGSNAVLCLNGWFGSAANWGPWEECLDKERFTWVFHEYPGYGMRIDEAPVQNLDGISSDIADSLAQLKEYDSLTLLGHSMGGAFAQHLLLQHCEIVDAFIGISPVPASGTRMPSEQRSLFEAAEWDVSSRRMIIDITTGNRLTDVWLDAMSEETRTASSDEAVGVYFRAWADCDFLEDLGQIEIPALVVVGSQDPAVTAIGARNTYGKVFPQLEILDYPDAGHYSMNETPVRLASDIECFLQSKLRLER